MGFMDELRKLTQPYDDEDDFFEGADPSFKPKPKPAEEGQTFSAAPKTFASAKPFGAASKTFEDSFGEEVPEPEGQRQAAAGEGGAGLFGNRGAKKPAKPKVPGRERTMNFGGKDTRVILFSPKSFDEAGDLVEYILQNTTVVMTLEGVTTEMGRRMLDFMSGIAFALQGKITPVSAKTYFVTPQNVDILGAQTAQPESAGHYF